MHGASVFLQTLTPTGNKETLIQRKGRAPIMTTESPQHDTHQVTGGEVPARVGVGGVLAWGSVGDPGLGKGEGSSPQGGGPAIPE